MTYRYALVNRPPGIGCIPRNLEYTVEPRPPAGAAHHAWARHGILVTVRELTVDELASFELAPLVDGELLDTMAARVAGGSMGDYAAEYVEVARDDPDAFRDGVLTAVTRLDPGVRYSIGDELQLTQAVLAHLAKQAGTAGA
jgi:hypothetical protein